MAYRKSDVGLLVSSDPKQAATLLKGILAEVHGNLARLADRFEVDYRTAQRWIVRLAAAGYDLSEAKAEAIRLAKVRGHRIYRKFPAAETPQDPT
jgi:transposase